MSHPVKLENLPRFDSLSADQDGLDLLLKNAILGYLSVNVSHKMNNYLTGMMGYVQLSMNSINTDAKTRRNLSRVFDCCESIKIFNKTILELFMASPHNQLVGNTANCLHDLIEFCSQLFEPDCKITLEDVTLPKGITIPETQFKELLLYLLLSIQSSIQGRGEIAIDGFHQREMHLEKTERMNTYLVFDIQAKVQSTINRASSFDISHENSMQQLNLNQYTLKLANELVTQWKGHIKERNDEEGNTGFRVFLPIQLGTDAVYFADLKSNENKAERSFKILLLEDQEMISEFMKSFLEKENHEVTVFNDGRETEEYLTPDTIKQYELFLLDVYVPGRSGLDIARQIRQHHSGSKILFYSALTSREIVEKSFPLDQNTDFMAKPFKKEELLNKINQLL